MSESLKAMRERLAEDLLEDRGIEDPRESEEWAELCGALRELQRAAIEALSFAEHKRMGRPREHAMRTLDSMRPFIDGVLDAAPEVKP